MADILFDRRKANNSMERINHIYSSVYVASMSPELNKTNIPKRDKTTYLLTLLTYLRND
jgi:hypothetical protein